MRSIMKDPTQNKTINHGQIWGHGTIKLQGFRLVKITNFSVQATKLSRKTRA